MTDGPLRVALAPDPADWARAAVEAGGGTVVGLDEEPEALVWTVGGDWERLEQALRPSTSWVQLPFAGVEGVADALDPQRTWTCAKGVYAEPVAEHALALLLAALRVLPERARARSWGEQAARTLYDAHVVVLGGGGITRSLLELLAPFRCRVTVVRRDPAPLPGAAAVVTPERLHEVLPGALAVVLALALTPDTEGVLDARALAALDDGAVVVNVARGRHVDTEALVAELRAGRLVAALDVTEPEPLPDDHPLFALALVTPHTANPWSTAKPLLARRVTENVRRRRQGQELLGLVDVARGY